MFEKSWIMAKTEIRMVFKNRQVKSVPILMVVMAVTFATVLPYLVLSTGEFPPEMFSYIMDAMMATVIVVMPIILPMTIAADSVIGEKERKTLLPLLKTPLTDNEIIFGKMLTALIPGLIVAYASFLLSVVSLNVGLLFYAPSYMWLWPTPLAIAQAVVYPPLFSALAVSIMIMLSTKVTKVYEAYQLGGMITIPALMLGYSQFLPGTTLHWSIFLIGTAVMVGANYFAFMVARNIFSRNELLSRR